MIGSAVVGVATLALVCGERFELGAVHRGRPPSPRWRRLGAGPEPRTCCPGELTLEQAAAADSTLIALLASLGGGRAGAGALALVYLYRLVLRGKLDQNYEPLDQRFG